MSLHPEKNHPLWKDFEKSCKKLGIIIDSKREWYNSWLIFLDGAEAQMYRDHEKKVEFYKGKKVEE